MRGGGEQRLGTTASQAVTYSGKECVAMLGAIYLHAAVKDIGFDNLTIRKCWVCNTENIYLTCPLILTLDPFSWIMVVSI